MIGFGSNEINAKTLYGIRPCVAYSKPGQADEYWISTDVGHLFICMYFILYFILNDKR